VENELVKSIKNLKIENLNTADMEELLQIFNVVKSADLRNQIALVFFDLKYEKAVPSIIKKIIDKELFNKTGTLIFSLSNLDVKKHFITLIKVICEQGYEARLMAFQIIEKYAQSVSPQVNKKSLTILNTQRAEKEKSYSKTDYANSALNFIDQTIKLLENS
jgi:hypothetical protein